MKNVKFWAFPGPVPEPAEGGPGRVLLAEHPRLIEPLARLATKVRRPLTRFQCGMCSVGCGMIIQSVFFSKMFVYL